MRVYDNKELRPVSYYGIIIAGVNTCVNFYSVVTESAATEQKDPCNKIAGSFSDHSFNMSYSVFPFPSPLPSLPT